MTSQQKRLITWGIILLLVATILAWLLAPRPLAVAIAQAEKGTFVLSISDEGKTRIHDIYQVSAPVAGQLKRIDVEIGDQVLAARTVIAEIEPSNPSFLDARGKTQLTASIQAAESAMSIAQAELLEAEAELSFADKEFTRIAALRAKKIAAERELDNALRLKNSAQAALETARAALQMRQYQFEEIKAMQVSPVTSSLSGAACECLNIYSPIDGLVMKVHNRSAGVIAAATPLLEVGNPNDLEILVELLSTDAVQVEVGQQAQVHNWGGPGSLPAQVTQVEPIGFTKVSALGIEEQRVNVLLVFTGNQTQWSRLGHGYQVDVEILLRQEDEQLLLPLTALVRQQGHWAVYLVKNNYAQLTKVEVAGLNNQFANIVGGIEEGQHYVLYPNNEVSHGVKVTPLK